MKTRASSKVVVHPQYWVTELQWDWHILLLYTSLTRGRTLFSLFFSFSSLASLVLFCFGFFCQLSQTSVPLSRQALISFNTNAVLFRPTHLNSYGVCLHGSHPCTNSVQTRPVFFKDEPTPLSSSKDLRYAWSHLSGWLLGTVYKLLS